LEGIQCQDHVSSFQLGFGGFHRHQRQGEGSGGRTKATVRGFHNQDDKVPYFQLTWLEVEPQNYVGVLLEGSFGDN